MAGLADAEDLEVDAAGLDAMDRRYLKTIAENYGGGPVGALICQILLLRAEPAGPRRSQAAA